MRPTPALAYRASIAAACAVAAGRLLPYLGDRVMHRDEALAVMVARRPLGELLETVQLVRGGAPLHFLLAKAVAELDGGLVATRAISALGLLLAIVAVGLLGRALGGPAVGAAAAWIAALSPVALYYGDFARMYSLFLAFSALALWCLVRALETDEPRYWAGTAALLVLDTYTHPYGVVVGLIAALAVLAELLQVRERAAWRRPLFAAAGVIAGTAPLGIGYLVLASRLDKVPQPPGTLDPQALAARRRRAGRRAFRGRAAQRRADRALPARVRRAGARGARDARPRRRGRAVLVASWIVLPLAVLAVVRIPNSDNHVRYVIEACRSRASRSPTARRRSAAMSAGAARSRPRSPPARSSRPWRPRAGRASPTTATAATRGPQRKADLAGAAGYLRANFARNDLFLGYDEAFAAGVLSPGRQRRARVGARDGALGARADRALARAPARPDRARLVRRAARIQRCALRALPHASSRPTTRWRRSGPGSCSCARARPVATPRAFARAGLRVFEAAQELSAPKRAPSEQAAVTAEALRGALPDLR